MGDTRSAAPLLLTAPEVAAVVSRLEGEPCSVRRVRYLLSGLSATDAAPPRGEVRLWGPVDVALMRLAVRLGTQGLSPWVARVVLTYSGAEIRAAWTSGASVALAVRGVTGSIEGATPGPDAPAVAARVLLRSVFVGTVSAIRQERRARPTIWRWKARPATALAQASA
jgi:hypothetical protein